MCVCVCERVEDGLTFIQPTQRSAHLYTDCEDSFVLCTLVQCSVCPLRVGRRAVRRGATLFFREPMTNVRSMRAPEDCTEKLMDTKMLLRRGRMLCACVKTVCGQRGCSKPPSREPSLRGLSNRTHGTPEKEKNAQE